MTMAVESHSFSSTRIASADRDEETGDTTVTFIRGDTRDYRAIPQDVWERWKTAWSPGRYFEDEIEGYE